jgi:hypothetical protein
MTDGKGTSKEGMEEPAGHQRTHLLVAQPQRQQLRQPNDAKLLCRELPYRPRTPAKFVPSTGLKIAGVAHQPNVPQIL